MEFSISKDVFLKGLSKTQSIIEKKTTLPILSNILIEAKEGIIQLIATDLEVGVKGIYEAEVKEEGNITVAAKKLFEIVRELQNDTINVKKIENNRLEITSGAAQFKIVCLPADDFPILPTFEEGDFSKVPAQMFAEMIEKVQHATSLDETRYYLNGVFFQSVEKDDGKYLRMVATDGHRLALIDREMPKGVEFELSDGCIIPRKGINELKKALTEVDDDASFCFKDKNLVVRCDNLMFLIRLIDDDFPEYSQVIPENNERVLSCPRDDLYGSLRRVSVLSTDLSKGVKFSLKKKSLEISSSNPELGEAKEKMVVGYEDENMSIGFNAKYFLDVLGVIKDEDIIINLADDLSPGLIAVPSDPGFSAVIMPMRI